MPNGMNFSAMSKSPKTKTEAQIFPLEAQVTLTETTNLQPSNSESSAFFQLDERIRRWIWQAGWTELKDAQERAIPIILEGQRDVIIAAATASGKTEAAYFPILTACSQKAKVAAYFT